VSDVERKFGRRGTAGVATLGALSTMLSLKRSHHFFKGSFFLL
jgi:hypothetical protein